MISVYLLLFITDGWFQKDYIKKKTIINQHDNNMRDITKLPWCIVNKTIRTSHYISGDIVALAPGYKGIPNMEISAENWPANAEFIVKACNSYGIGKIISYGIKEGDRGWDVIIEATKFDEKQNPISWAVRQRGGTCMSKITGEFEWESNQSNRDDGFYEEYRFDSAEEAKKTWDSFN